MSIASQHTPGDWNVVKCGCGHPSCKRYGTDNGVFPDGAGYSLADAQLAAASPDLLEALRPFVHEFNERREAYIRRYPRNPGVGANNFDSMPDEWPMERLTFTMGDFRRASAAIAKAVSQ